MIAAKNNAQKYRTKGHEQVLCQFTKQYPMRISIDFWPKIYLIFYPSLENSTTHITIMAGASPHKNFRVMPPNNSWNYYPTPTSWHLRFLRCCKCKTLLLRSFYDYEVFDREFYLFLGLAVKDFWSRVLGAILDIAFVCSSSSSWWSDSVFCSLICLAVQFFEVDILYDILPYW